MSEPDIRSLLHEAFTPAEGAIVTLVDRLLRACQGRRVLLTHGPEGCHASWSSFREEPTRQSSFVGEATFPLPRAAFRSLLARIAALCNRRTLDSVSPYGGDGLLVADAGPSLFQAVFKNTKGDLALDLRHIGDPAAFAEPPAALDPRDSALAPIEETPPASSPRTRCRSETATIEADGSLLAGKEQPDAPGPT